MASVLIAAGLVALGLAASLLTAIGDHDPSGPAPAPSPTSEPSPSSAAFVLSGPGDISVVRQVYEPGEDSGWHAHPGIHAVTILSGALTVYDGTCRAETFGPGRPYIGGQELHLARNETDTPVDMAVTYVSPAAPGRTTQHLQPPAGCQLGSKANG